MWTYQQYSLNLNTVVWTFSKRHKTKIEFWKKNLFFCMYIWCVNKNPGTCTYIMLCVQLYIFAALMAFRIIWIFHMMGNSSLVANYHCLCLINYEAFTIPMMIILEMPMHRSLRKRKVSPVSSQDSSLIETTCLDKHLGHLKVDWITKHHSSWSSSPPSSSWSWSLTW